MCVCVCVCLLCVLAVWYSSCVLGSGPEVLSSSSTQAIFHLVFHLVFHLPPTSPTSPFSYDWDCSAIGSAGCMRAQHGECGVQLGDCGFRRVIMWVQQDDRGFSRVTVGLAG